MGSGVDVVEVGLVRSMVGGVIVILVVLVRGGFRVGW